MLWIFSFTAAVVACIWGTFCRNENLPIFGVYRTNGPNWPLKFILMYIVLTARKLWNMMKLEDIDSSVALAELLSEKYEGNNAGYGSRSRGHPAIMEQPQNLSPHPQAIDAVYFNGASECGWNIIAATARRPKGVVNGFLFIRIPGVGLLTAPRHPDTTMLQSPPQKEFSAEGLTLTPVVPMVAWTLNYDGLLRVEATCEGSPLTANTMVKANLRGLWTSSLPYFDFDVDMSPYAVASAMAKQPWSRNYFKTLKKNHQTHYEQFGDLKGTVSIEGKEYAFNLSSMRDHSYGEKREWKDYHRYALHFFTTKNNIKLAMGVLCIPSMFSRLVIGYVYTPDGELHAVQSSTFKLHEHGEGGTPPTDYGFSVAAGGEIYDVQVQVEASSHVYLMETRDAKVIESFARGRINGHAAWGAVEFDYRHTDNTTE